MQISTDQKLWIPPNAPRKYTDFLIQITIIRASYYFSPMIPYKSSRDGLEIETTIWFNLRTHEIHRAIQRCTKGERTAFDIKSCVAPRYYPRATNNHPIFSPASHFDFCVTPTSPFRTCVSSCFSCFLSISTSFRSLSTLLHIGLACVR